MNRFFKASLQIGTVFYMRNESLIYSDQPHPHIVIHITTHEIILLGCTTSQIDKRIRFVEINELPESSLVFFKPNENNGLTRETLVDCNSSIFPKSKEEMIKIRNKFGISLIGNVSESKVEELRKGIKDSPLIPQYIKDMLDS